METRIESADEKTRVLETRVDHIETNTQRLSESLTVMEDSVQLLLYKMSETQEKMHVLSARMEKLKQDTEHLDTKLTELNAETQRLQKEYQSLTELFQTQTDQLREQAEKLANFKWGLVAAAIILTVMAIVAGYIINELKGELKDTKKEADEQRVDMAAHKKEIADNHEKITAIVSTLNIKQKVDRYAERAENQKRVQVDMLKAIDAEKNRLMAKRDRSYPLLGSLSRHRYHVAKLAALSDIEEHYAGYDSDTIISLLINAYNNSGYMPDAGDEKFLSQITEMINRKIPAYTRVDAGPRLA